MHTIGNICWRLGRLGAALVGCLLLAGCLATSATPTPAPTPGPLPDPSTRSGQALAALRFESPVLGARMQALDACARSLPGTDWRHHPYTTGGNFYEAKWCRGSGARADCQIAEAGRHTRDQHLVALYTLFYDLPDVWGLGLAARWVPPGAGWGVALSIDEEGKGVVGAGFGFGFARYPSATGDPDLTVTLGDEYSYKIHETRVSVAADGPLDAEIARYLASPEAMRDRGLAQLDALAAKVRATLDAHAAQTCEYGPYQGDGIPPACTLRPLTPAEEQVARTAAEAHFAAQTAALRTDYAAMYAALQAAFPLSACWK